MKGKTRSTVEYGFSVQKIVNVGEVRIGNGSKHPLEAASELAVTDFIKTVERADSQEIRNGIVETYEFEFDGLEHSFTYVANPKPDPSFGDSQDHPIGE
jgi:hypothetical protein